MKISYVMMFGLMGCLDVAEEGTKPGPEEPQENDTAGDSGGGLRPEIVFGTDDRQQVTPTLGYPARARCRIVTTWPNGTVTACTGYLVSAQNVLTAGECVHQNARGGWATNVNAAPAQDGSYKPYGDADSTKLRSVTNWTQNEDPAFDFALVTLAHPLGNLTGWYAVVSMSESELNGQPAATIAGYPGDKPLGTQWAASGNVLEHNTNQLFYTIDIELGEAGGGVAHSFAGAHGVIGVQRGSGPGPTGAQRNIATRITDARLAQINGWITADN